MTTVVATELRAQVKTLKCPIRAYVTQLHIASVISSPCYSAPCLSTQAHSLPCCSKLSDTPPSQELYL